jgi:NADH-quinone oxidoreductase subunit B
MLLDAILKLHAKIQDEPMGPRRAALRVGKRTELIPSSIKYAKK